MHFTIGLRLRWLPARYIVIIAIAGAQQNSRTHDEQHQKNAHLLNSLELYAHIEIKQQNDRAVMVLFQPGEKQKTHPKVRLFLEQNQQFYQPNASCCFLMSSCMPFSASSSISLHCARVNGFSSAVPCTSINSPAWVITTFKSV